MKINIEFFKESDKKHIHSKEDQFIIDWDRELGWKRNPFEPRVLDPPDKFISGYIQERLKINLFVIKKYNFGVIHGEPGTGRTTLLKWMEFELKKHKNKLYANYISGKNLTGEKETIKRIIWPFIKPYHMLAKPHEKLTMNTLGDFLRKKLKKKRLVLLVDDIGSISDLAMVVLKKLYMADVPVQIIVSGTTKEIDNSGILEIGGKDYLKISLKKMDYNDLRTMIKKRVEAAGGKDILPFNDSELKKLAKQIDYNPKKLIEVCYNNATEISVEKWHLEKENFQKLQKKIEKEQKGREKEEKILIEEEEDLLQKQMTTTEEVEKEILDLKTQGHKETDFDTRIDIRKKRIAEEKKLKNIFDEIEKKIKEK